MTAWACCVSVLDLLGHVIMIRAHSQCTVSTPHLFQHVLHGSNTDSSMYALVICYHACRAYLQSPVPLTQPSQHSSRSVQQQEAAKYKAHVQVSGVLPHISCQNVTRGINAAQYTVKSPSNSITIILASARAGFSHSQLLC